MDTISRKQPLCCNIGKPLGSTSQPRGSPSEATSTRHSEAPKQSLRGTPQNLAGSRAPSSRHLPRRSLRRNLNFKAIFARDLCETTSTKNSFLGNFCEATPRGTLYEETSGGNLCEAASKRQSPRGNLYEAASPRESLQVSLSRASLAQASTLPPQTQPPKNRPHPLSLQKNKSQLRDVAQSARRSIAPCSVTDAHCTVAALLRRRRGARRRTNTIFQHKSETEGRDKARKGKGTSGEKANKRKRRKRNKSERTNKKRRIRRRTRERTKRRRLGRTRATSKGNRWTAHMISRVITCSQARDPHYLPLFARW